MLNAGGEQVSDGNGRVDLDDPDHKTMIATISKQLIDGAYMVQWHALLTDGDASDGTFGFTMRAGGAPAQSAPTATATRRRRMAGWLACGGCWSHCAHIRVDRVVAAEGELALRQVSDEANP